ncbi:histone-lysine N-methyltransferase, H3 lysine-79 specific-like isoform X2 [Culicoides brevitarsis]|uniref:histone-lysine N-methyltransferase, H3 lysine-79 specific-like isoform X2 n=1 Tax=Culicoides brevitarsis TaxID=469753 RepID=UPI00307C2D27
MEHLEQQLCDASKIYFDFEANLKTGIDSFLKNIDDLIKSADAEKTPNPKGKRAKHMAPIPDEDSDEETGSTADSTLDSTRPQRSTRARNTTSYKEPSLNTKIRRPNPEKAIKKERITMEGGKENVAPNKSNDETTNKKRSSEESVEEKAKKVSVNPGCEIVETPVETVVIDSDDETDKMPPPAMPAPKARGRPRTRKASQKPDLASETIAEQVMTPIKLERTSIEESPIELEKKRDPKSKAKKKLPMPIEENVIKKEKISVDKRPSAGSEASVYEEASSNVGISTKNSLENPPVLNETYKTTPNTTVTLENATFNVPKIPVNNETFQVDSPVNECNGTYTVPTAAVQTPPTAPEVHDSIMTEDHSGDEEEAFIAKMVPPKEKPALVMPKKKHEVFNPNTPSPFKEKIQAFEKFASSGGLMSPIAKLKSRQITTPSTSKLTTPSNLPRIPQYKPASTHVTPLGQSSSAPLMHKGSASVSKMLQMPKKMPKTASMSAASSRDPSVEDLKRTQSAIEAKKKAREEKQRLAQQQREAIERERRERARQLQKEKDEKHRKLLQEKEDRKREAMSQKKLEEHVRNQKILEQKRRELAEKEALEAAKAKHNESLQRKVLEKQHAKAKGKHDFEYLDTDDSTDDEGKMNRNRNPVPDWSKSSNRRQTNRKQTYISLQLVDKFFSVEPMTPDLKEIFPNIEEKKLKRNSSAVWNTPPRYSQMPKY